MAQRSDAWNAFINNIHNYNVGGHTLGAPKYHSGSKFAHHAAANDSQKEDQDDTTRNIDYQAKAQALQSELAKAQATIRRWETVNNKLMAQLQK